MEGPIYVLWAWLILVACFLYVYGLKSDYNYQIFFDQKFDIQSLYNLFSQHLGARWMLQLFCATYASSTSSIPSFLALLMRFVFTQTSCVCQGGKTCGPEKNLKKTGMYLSGSDIT